MALAPLVRVAHTVGYYRGRARAAKVKMGKMGKMGKIGNRD